MSKSITITLPNDVADTLNRRMDEIAASTIPGVKNSKSAYVATAIKVQLIKEGCVVVANEPAKKRKKRTKKGTEPTPTTNTPVAGVADYRLDEQPPTGALEQQTAPTEQHAMNDGGGESHTQFEPEHSPQ